MRARLLLLSVAVVATLPLRASIIFPLNADTQSQIQQSLNGTTYARPIVEGTYQTLTATSGPNSAFGEADFDAGTIKASLTNSTTGFSAVSAWEFVSFDIAGGGSTLISWAMDFDGSLSNPSATSFAYANVYAFIFDVTGDSSYFLQFPQGSGGVIQIASSSNLVSCYVFNGIVHGSSNSFDTGAGFCPDETKDRRENSDGTVQNFSGTLTDSFTANNGSLYLVQLVTILQLSSGGGAADFSNTATFSFSSLGSSTLQSASGSFLADQASDVPEPGTWLLAGVGLLGLAGRRYMAARR